MKYKVGDTIRNTEDHNDTAKILDISLSKRLYTLELKDGSTKKMDSKYIDGMTELYGGGFVPASTHVGDVSLYCQCTNPTIKKVLIGIVTADKYNYCTTCKKEKL